MHVIYSGEGAQSVGVYATDIAGQLVAPTSATVRIVDLELPESDPARIVLAASAATVDATATTTTAAAGGLEADPRRIAVTSATGFVVGRKYALSSGGAREVFELDSVEGLVLVSASPLLSRTSFATGAAVTGLLVSGTFPSAVADDPDELDRADAVGGRAAFGVDWSFAGVTGPTVVRTLAVIERRGKLPRATRWEILRIDPQLAQAQHDRGSIEQSIRQADEEIDALLMHHGYAITDDLGLVGQMATRWRTIELIYTSLGAEHETRAERAAEHAKSWARRLTSGRKSTDTIETDRATDQRRGRRARTGIGAI